VPIPHANSEALPGGANLLDLPFNTIITTIYAIGFAMRLSKSFTIESEISEYVLQTKGEQSASERVNNLLRRAMLEEKYERLEKEAAAFFSEAGASKSDRKETHAYQKAARRAFQRD
jgi:hypothetical protein